jgi:hypothetical protein
MPQKPKYSFDFYRTQISWIMWSVVVWEAKGEVE